MRRIVGGGGRLGNPRGRLYGVEEREASPGDDVSVTRRALRDHGHGSVHVYDHDHVDEKSYSADPSVGAAVATAAGGPYNPRAFHEVAR
jgi:hypothetical protein